MRPRVLVLNQFALPRSSAGGTRHVELGDRLEGWDALILAGNRNLFSRLSFSEASPTYRTVWTSPYRANGWLRVLNWVSYCLTVLVAGARGPRPDVVYASSPHLLTGLTGWLLALLRNARFVLEVRDLWPRSLVDLGQLQAGSPLHRLLDALERFLYARADGVVTVTGAWDEHIRERGGRGKPLVTISNGADPADFDLALPRVRFRERYGLSGFAAVFAGAHGPKDGLDLVLDAAAELRDVRFLLVGDGMDKPRLVARAKAEGLANVTFLDPIPKDQIPGLLAAADVGLHIVADVPLFKLGMSPNKLFDYMAAGLPALTNAEGEAGAIVTEAGAGVAVAPRAVAAGVRAIVEAGPGQRRSWGANGRAWVAAHRSRTASAQRLEALLDEVAAAVRRQ